MSRLAAVLTILFAAISPPVLAQNGKPVAAFQQSAAQGGQRRPLFEISANVGAQTGGREFTVSDTFMVNAENATLTVNHAAKTAFGFNVGGAVNLLPQLGVGAQYAMVDAEPTADITAIVPHPLLFNAPRTVQGAVSDVTHQEHNIHVDVMYALPGLRAVDLKIMGGPTFFNVQQEFIVDVTLNETYPFDTASLEGATKTQLSQSAVGFNVGVDIARAVAPQVAVGGLVRYSQADVTFDDPAVGQQTVRAGGVEATAGVRFRF